MWRPASLERPWFGDWKTEASFVTRCVWTYITRLVCKRLRAMGSEPFAAPQGRHWKTKVEAGAYLSPAGSSKVWKMRFDALHTAVTKTGLIRTDEMPWLDTRYAGNAFVMTRFTGRYLWLKLTVLARTQFVRLDVSQDACQDGFLGILRVEVPEDSIRVFNESPMCTRALFAKNRRARKTSDRCWRTFGFVETKRTDGTVVLTFDARVAITIGEQNSRARHRRLKQLGYEEDEDEAAGAASEASSEDVGHEKE
jgi:hypothetical protein